MVNDPSADYCANPDAQIGAVESDAASLGQTSVLAKPPKANRAITVPEKPFVLDPIL